VFCESCEEGRGGRTKVIIEFTVQGVRVYPRELSDLALGKITEVMGVREVLCVFCWKV